MKIICIGRNYQEHAKELNNPVPSKPVFFLKPDTALLRNNQPFYIPSFSNEIHYETELVVRISRVGKNIDPKFSHRYYHEVALGVDFTARDLQNECKAKGLPWEIAKAFDHAAVISTFIPLTDAGPVNEIPFSLMINQKLVQQGNTSEMIFDVDFLISYLSRFFTLKMGDLIYTGTPHGVGPVHSGDQLTGYIGDRQMFDFQVR
jgi:2-keto-4-pentenoate hydratase/2-oxohepta-3-ene-1,7-dioic acid hydratase in catechol pathway